MSTVGDSSTRYVLFEHMGIRSSTEGVVLPPDALHVDIRCYPVEPPSITIRPAREADCGFVYFLSMDTTVRLNSTRQDLFGSDEHESWWYRRFHDPNTKIWVMEVDGQAVGQVRYGRVIAPSGYGNFLRTEAEIAISILSKYRGKGYARTLLTATMPWACEWLKVDTLVALVLRTNRASRRLFRKADFKYVGVECRMDKTHARYEWHS